MEGASHAELEQEGVAAPPKEQKASAKEKPKRPGKSLKLPFGPKSWIAALQLTAALVVFGFITKLSHEQLLGIQLSDWTALNLTLFAGRCAVDTLTILLEQPVPHVLLAGLLALPLAAYIALPLDHRLSRPAALASLGIVVAGLLVVLVWNEIPTLKMKDWLTHNIKDQLHDGSGDGFIASRETALRASLFIWKLDSFAGDGSGTVSFHCPYDASKGDATPQVLQENMVGPYPWAAAHERLNSIYAASVFFCVLGWLVVCLPAPATESAVEEEWMRLVRAALVLALLPAVTVLLPYLYGKLLISTNFPLANIELMDPGILFDKEQVLLIDETDKDVTILRAPYKNQEIPSLVVVPREQIVRPIQLHQPQDVILQSIINNCDWLPTKPEQ